MSILKVSIRQLKAARALLGWSQEELATASDVSLPTIKRLEAAEGWLAGVRPPVTKFEPLLNWPVSNSSTRTEAARVCACASASG